MSGRVIRVVAAAKRLSPSTVEQVVEPRNDAPPTPAPTQPVPVINVTPPAVNVDTAELAKQLALNNELLRQVLAELKRKKKWQFEVNRDALGRPFQIDANEA